MINKPHPFRLSNSRLDSLAKGDNHGMTWCVVCHEHENNEIHRNYEPFEILSIPITTTITGGILPAIMDLTTQVEAKRQAMEQAVDWILRDYDKRLDKLTRDVKWLKADMK